MEAYKTTSSNEGNTMRINANKLRGIVREYWFSFSAKYLWDFNQTGNFDLCVSHCIKHVPGGYAWFNGLTDSQRVEFVAIVNDEISNLV
jgi:hypothetical protein